MLPRGGGVASQLASILVTDLVGSTAQRVRLGEDRAEALGRVHDALLHRAVEAFGGRVVKFMGDAVLAVFGGAAEAVEAAVAVQQAAARHTRRNPDEPLVMRVGVSAGDVTHEGGDVFGTPVIEASRLCAVADGGEILVAELVRTLAHGRGDHVFGERRDLELKGLAGPVAARPVAWAAAGRSGAALPPLLEVAAATPVVGRDRELGVLAEAWDLAGTTGPQVALLAGEPGIGKTTLAGSFARSRHADGALVLMGRCDAELGAPFGPVVDALQHLVRSIDDRVLRDQVGTDAGVLVRLVPRLAERIPEATPLPPTGDPELDRRRTFEAICSWMLALSPVVVVLDDVHDADSATLLLLRHLARRRDLPGVVVVATYRDVELTRTHPLAALLGDLRAEATVRRIGVTGLDGGGLADLVEVLAGHDLGDDGRRLAIDLHRTTDGNPFFATEILRHLDESGALVRGDGRWRSAGPTFVIPEGVREVVGHRLSRLDEEANTVLRVAAVVGRSFDLGVVSDAAEVSEDDVLVHLEAAMAARLVEEIPGALDRFGFTHGIFRETLYDEVATSRRVRLHRRIGRAIEARHAAHLQQHVAELAHHFGEAAAGGDVDEAVRYARLAADAAIGASAWEDAAAHLERAVAIAALREPADEGERGSLLLARADLSRQTADWRRAWDDILAAIEIARRAGLPELHAQAAIPAMWVAYNLYGFGGGAAAQGLLDEALAAVGGRPTANRALLLGAKALYGGGVAEQQVAGTEAIEIARQLGDPGTLLSVLQDASEAFTGPRQGETFGAIADEISAHMETMPNDGSAWWLDRLLRAQTIGVGAALRRGDVRRFRTLVARQGEYAQLLHQPVLLRYHLVWKASLALLAGEWAVAEELALAARRTEGRDDQVLAKAELGVQLFQLGLERGGLETMLVRMERRAATKGATVPAYRAALVRHWVSCGRHADAQRELDVLMIGLDDLFEHDGSWSGGMCLLAAAAIGLNDQAAALALHDRMAPFDEVVVIAGSSATVGGALGLHTGRLATLLGRHEEAAEHLRVAREVHERLESPPWIAHTDAALAENGGPGADEARRRALDVAQRLGMTVLLERLEARA